LPEQEEEGRVAEETSAVMHFCRRRGVGSKQRVGSAGACGHQEVGTIPHGALGERFKDKGGAKRTGGPDRTGIGILCSRKKKK